MNDTRSNAASSSPRKPRLLTDTRGAGLVEYIVLVGLVALAAIMGFQTFGGQVNDKAIDLGERVDEIGN
jgi:Flp pilus assembly pilin Flp